MRKCNFNALEVVIRYNRSQIELEKNNTQSINDNDLTNESTVIYPNPTGNEITITAKNNQELNLANLKTGMFLIKTKTTAKKYMKNNALWGVMLIFRNIKR